MTEQVLPTESVAEAYLALLHARGVSRLFVNGGTDFAPIAEAYARKSGLDFPTPVVVPHENVAVGMAHGAYLVTGKPQAVMLHVSVGTANAVMAIMNASRDRVPILLTAGRTPLFEQGVLGARNGQIHWAQEMFDQAGMLREMVKWDYELRDGVQLEAIVDRAMSLAMSEPRGPIYLTLPREILARPFENAQFSGPPELASDPAAAPRAIDELADVLASASLPVIVASAAATEPGAYAALDQLARDYAIGILENAPRVVNASSAHPLHLGYGTRSIFDDADVLCFAECDVPWVPSAGEPPKDTTIIQLGIDPLFARYPVRTHRADLVVTGSSRLIFEALAAALEERKGKIDPARFGRIAELAVARKQQHQQAMTAQAASNSAGITKAFMNAALAEVRKPEMIVVDEYWARADSLASTLEGTEFHNPPAGGLGWGLPAALGVQLESPGQTVISTLGDGAYLFANPPACHQVMATNRLPIVTIVCNNGRWGAVEGSARGMYPSGHVANSETSSPLARLDQSHAFELYAEATGGYGEKVTERDELVPAFKRALDVAANEQRHVLLNVLCTD